MTAATPARSEQPYAIFAKARYAWERAMYPPELSYSVTVTVVRGAVHSIARYHAFYDSRRNLVRTNGVSDQELAHSYTPHGINTFLNLFGGSIPLSAPQRTFDYLGVPLLAPNYSFGIAPYVAVFTGMDSMQLVNEIRKEFHDPAPIRRQTTTQGNGRLKTIAVVNVSHRRYIITLGGMAEVNGHADYVLLLHPVSDPATYRLRRLWIDARTFATDALVTQGNFTAPGLSNVSWTVQFKQIGGAPYIASEQSRSAFAIDRRSYDGATLTFTNIVPRSIPAFANLATFATNSATAPDTLTEPAFRDR
jgi:hypothetical protein